MLQEVLRMRRDLDTEYITFEHRLGTKAKKWRVHESYV